MPARVLVGMTLFVVVSLPALDGLHNFLALFLDQVLLHGIFILMPLEQLCKLYLLLQLRSRVFKLSLPLPLLSLGLISCTVFAKIILFGIANLIFLAQIYHPFVLLYLLTTFASRLLVNGVIHIQLSSQDLCTAEIVDGKIGTPLIGVLEPSKATALASFAVTGELDKCGLAVLREDCDDVAFVELERYATYENVGGVTVVGVPGSGGSAVVADQGVSIEGRGEELYDDWGS